MIHSKATPRCGFFIIHMLQDRLDFLNWGKKMQTIINGKKYDTSDAQEIADNLKGYVSDLNYVSHTLYQTKSGDFFLYAEGGIMTIFSKPVILPMTKEQSDQWLGILKDPEISYERTQHDLTEIAVRLLEETWEQQR